MSPTGSAALPSAPMSGTRDPGALAASTRRSQREGPMVRCVGSALPSRDGRQASESGERGRESIRRRNRASASLHSPSLLCSPRLAKCELLVRVRQGSLQAPLSQPRLEQLLLSFELCFFIASRARPLRHRRASSREHQTVQSRDADAQWPVSTLALSAR